MKKTLLVFLFMLLGTLLIHSSTTGSIMGFVLDEEIGIPIEDARVTVIELGLVTGTDAAGLFLFAGLNVGVYSVLVEKLGYQPVRIENIVVSLGQVSTHSVVLRSSPLEIKTPIIVTAERSLINRLQTGAVTKIDHTQIVDMSARDIFRAAELAPGAVTNEDGQIKVRGTRESNTTFLLDGLSIMDPFHNTFGSVINAKGIMGEVDVITGQFDAEYGNALGGVVNTVTRTPETKRYKFSASFDTSNAIPDWFGNAERYRILGEEEYNFTFEGPVPLVPDNRLGFLFTGQAFFANSSTSSGFQNYEYEDFHDYHLKLDYRITPTDRLAFHMQNGFAWIRIQRRWEQIYPGWPIAFQFNRMQNLIFSRSITNDTFFRLALSWFYGGIDYGARAVDSATGAESKWHIKPFHEIIAGDFPAHQKSRHNKTELRFDLSSDMFTGHQIKGGFDIQRIHADLYWSSMAVSTYNISEATPFDYWYPWAFWLEEYAYEYYNTNAYIQDKWDVYDNIMLSYGIRFDYWGFLKTNNLKFQPRIGLTYQLMPETILRGNYVIKYQAPPIPSVYEMDSGVSWYLGLHWDWGSDEIKPEMAKTAELGLQHKLFDEWVLDVSYYKTWLEDVVSTFYDPAKDREEYSNIAQAFSQGLEITLKRSFTKFFDGWVTYTWMEAMGKNMPYRWYEQISSEDPIYGERYYLDFDQRHTINANITLKTDYALFNLMWRYGSGYPYTPHDSFRDWGRDGIKADPDKGIPEDPDGSEGDGVYQEGEPTYASDPAAVWNSARYPVYTRIDAKLRVKLPLSWFGASYWFNITCRNLFDNFNLRGAGGNRSGDINPYTGEPWSYATGGTPRRYTWGLEVSF